jgi:hypothetical protein
MSNAKLAFDYFVSQGLSPVQAAGIVGNLQGESGQGLNTNTINPAATAATASALPNGIAPALRLSEIMRHPKAPRTPTLTRNSNFSTPN